MLSRRTLVVAWSVTATLVLALLAVGAYTTSSWPFREPEPRPAAAEPTTTPSTTAAPSPVATAPATPEPPVAEVPSDPTGPTPEPLPEAPVATAPPVSQDVSVVITYADPVPDGGGVEVGAYAAIIEDAARCTLTLTKGSTVRTRTTDAAPDVTTMSCGQFLIPAAEVSKGTWSAVVTYSSAASSGKSSPSEVVVP